MNWVLHDTTLTPPPPPVSDPTNKISPSILLIILILAVIFFISGLLHLLVRYLIKPNARDTQDSFDNSTTAFQGQLQQLFDLHDSGVDQSFIDTLPVFLYKAIIGLKDPFDCAVCLCEFNHDDKLRLLPKCSHAFHLECIDTWLLSHSTCPLCRRNLLDYSNSCSPLVFVLESGGESSREIGTVSARREIAQNTHPASLGDDESGLSGNDGLRKSTDNDDTREETSEAKIVQVKLGKFRSVEASSVALGEGSSNDTGTGTESGTKNLDQRRCFSMGTYEYVMDELSSLCVPIKPPKKKPVVKRLGHRAAMSECDCHSRREGFKGFDQNMKISDRPRNADACKKLNTKESFSISKTWLRTMERSVPEANSRRSLSFQLPIELNSNSKIGNSSPLTESEYNVSTCDRSGSMVDWDVESANCENSAVPISRADEAPSFARRTLLWIMGRHDQR
jgi:Ring finger domain